MFKPVLLALIIVLASCAPTMQSSQAVTPYNVKEGPILVAAAGTRYVSYQISQKSFGFNDDDFSRTKIQNPRVGKRSYRDVTARLVATNKSLPEGWAASLESAHLIKEVKRVRRGRPSFSRWLTLTFEVSVPADAEPGEHRAKVLVSGEDGKEKTVTLKFAVETLRAER